MRRLLSLQACFPDYSFPDADLLRALAWIARMLGNTAPNIFTISRKFRLQACFPNASLAGILRRLGKTFPNVFILYRAQTTFTLDPLIECHMNVYMFSLRFL